MDSLRAKEHPPEEEYSLVEGPREEKRSPDKKYRRRIHMIGKKFRVPRANITTKRAERRVPGAFLRVSVVSNMLPHNRFAVVVSNHLVKTAALRHSVKRSIYDVCEPYTTRTPKGKDVICIISKPIQKNDLPRLRIEVQQLLPRAIA